MNTSNSTKFELSLILAAILGISVMFDGEPMGADTSKSAVDSPTKEEGVSVEVARGQAKIMHGIYAATLDAMHHHYFHGQRTAVPARALEDVFSEMKRQSRAEAKWISVNTRAMSIDHEPKSEFEKRAAKELASKPEIEVIENGYYRRAGAIPLTDGCISCHGGFFQPSKAPKFAGLVISLPVNSDSKQAK